MKPVYSVTHCKLQNYFRLQQRSI